MQFDFREFGNGNSREYNPKHDVEIIEFTIFVKVCKKNIMRVIFANLRRRSSLNENRSTRVQTLVMQENWI